MGFKAKNVEIGKFQSGWWSKVHLSITWDRHKELLEEHTESLEKKIKEQGDRLNYLEPKDENSLT
jgi:hypothetical protein